MHDGNSDDSDDEHPDTNEINSIMQLASSHSTNSNTRRGAITIILMVANKSQIQVTMNIDTLEMSVHMLKRLIKQDLYITGKLGIEVSHGFHLGLMNDNGNFEAFESTQSLIGFGIKNKHTLLIQIV